MFVFKDKAVNAHEIGRELGVYYVLEGSVRNDADKAFEYLEIISAEQPESLLEIFSDAMFTCIMDDPRWTEHDQVQITPAERLSSRGRWLLRRRDTERHRR